MSQASPLQGGAGQLQHCTDSNAALLHLLHAEQLAPERVAGLQDGWPQEECWRAQGVRHWACMSSEASSYCESVHPTYYHRYDDARAIPLPRSLTC